MLLLCVASYKEDSSPSLTLSFFTTTWVLGHFFCISHKLRLFDKLEFFFCGFLTSEQVFCGKILYTFTRPLDSVDWWQRLQAKTRAKMHEMHICVSSSFRRDIPGPILNDMTHNLGFFWLARVVTLKLFCSIGYDLDKSEQIIAIFWNTSSAVMNIPIYEHSFEYSNIRVLEYILSLNMNG